MAQPGFYVCGFNQSSEDYFPFVSALQPSIFPPATPLGADFRYLEQTFAEFFALVWNLREFQIDVNITDGVDTWTDTIFGAMFDAPGFPGPVDETEIGPLSCQDTLASATINGTFTNEVFNFGLYAYDYDYNAGLDKFYPAAVVDFKNSSTNSAVPSPPVVNTVVVTIFGKVFPMYDPGGSVLSGTVDVTALTNWAYAP